MGAWGPIRPAQSWWIRSWSRSAGGASNRHVRWMRTPPILQLTHLHTA